MKQKLISYFTRSASPSEIKLAWKCIITMLAIYIFLAAMNGIQIGQNVWVYWENSRFQSDVNAALHWGEWVLDDSQGLLEEKQRSRTETQLGYFDVFHGWVDMYDRVAARNRSEDYQLDYPPLRLLVMTLWTWHVRSEFPSIKDFPRTPNQHVIQPATSIRVPTQSIVLPLLVCNGVMQGISSIAAFFLVWLWVRDEDDALSKSIETRRKWGDPLLLVPIVVLAIAMIFLPTRSYVLAGDSAAINLDEKIYDRAWWLFVSLRTLSVLGLARFLPPPFRAVGCGLIAASLCWFNSASSLVSFGWPQWEAWLMPGYLICALLMSLNRWFAAGTLLAIGCMFKGQLLLVAPLPILCPLFAGWPGRFARVVLGFTCGITVVASPWLVHKVNAQAYVVGAISSAIVISLVSRFRSAIRLELLGLCQHVASGWRQNKDQLTSPVSEIKFVSGLSAPLKAAIVIGLVYSMAALTIIIKPPLLPAVETGILGAGIMIIPWLLSRRQIGLFLIGVSVISAWLAAINLSGSFSWWNVGFLYGTQKHQVMQLADKSLSNLCSILEKRYGWDLHDPMVSLNIRSGTVPHRLDIQSALTVLYFFCLILCTLAAGIHLRRRDPKFLVALVAPWILLVTLLPQMAARYTVYPAAASVVLVAVSIEMALLQPALVMLSCTMVGNQLLLLNSDAAPLTYSLTHRTFPDIAWLMIGIAMLLLVNATIPSQRSMQRQDDKALRMP